jgi:ubiquinone biosynthesis protein
MHLRYLHRIREILTVGLEEEFGYLIKKAELHKHIPFSKRLRASLKKKEIAFRPEVHLRQACERLGPTFIKFGQILSLRPDILPPEYIAELEKMQDHVPPVPFSHMKAMIESELGSAPEKLFKSIKTEPIASGSMAQVYKAQLKTGEIVAVKVQRPNIQRIVRDDIEILLFIAHWLEKKKTLNGFQLIPIVEEFKRWTLREINFKNEAANMKIFRENFKGSKDVVIPKVYDQYTTSRILTTQFIDGIPIHEITRLRKSRNAALLIQKTYLAIVEMVLHHGIFHADPHPGNILVQKNKIAFIDFGIVGRFDYHLRNVTLRLMRAAMNNDADEALEAILDLRTKETDIDKEQLRRDLQEIMDMVRMEKIKDIQISQLLSKVLDTIHHYRIEIPVDFTLFAKTVITMEGVGLRYSPQLRLLKEAEPIITKEVRRQYMPQSIAHSVKRHFDTYSNILEKTPEYFLNAMQRLGQGKVGIELMPQEFSDIRTELEHSSGNIAIGLMIAAITVSAALIMQSASAEQIESLMRLSYIGFSIAGVLSVWLMRRTVFIKEHVTNNG